MSGARRGRAAGFAAAAALCAGLAASVSGGERAGLAAPLGDLRDVVVAREPLADHRPLRRADAARVLEVRRVPARFVPPGVLSAPEQAIGRVPAVPVHAGGYLLESELDQPRGEPRRDRRLDAGQSPIEIAVAAAGPLAARPAPGGRVDVVVTTEPGPGGGAGRTYVAAEAVRLLGLREAGGSAPADALPGTPGAEWIATLALPRGEALRLIQAESFARSVRLIPR